ncbi:VacJ family lipoprotein [Noviherbaspirillum cavernae]|uniref:VacJ family lipoprotein n=1 Tax=Noviherbaspirillum cavernae TaxID=2320862 RepID=A0A418X464_9BURK|nr:VacJ family lipoprotein [Noviherbaspirillum cavernae]RJG07262.1 VacJ family lipoprotein [Noviherbaspirillum cavernae]
MSRVIRGSVALALTIAISGCATTNPKDPLEPYNRAVFTFNDKLDEVALKPTAQLYSTLPTFVQIGVGNFFGNLGDVWTAANNLMQGKVTDGVSDVMRVTVNTFFGFGGLLDWGTEAGLIKHREDFGQTLGRWGVQSGPYVVLPLLGASTLRDTIAYPIDIYGDPWEAVTSVSVRNTGYLVRLIDRRAALLDASSLLEDAALDRYEFVRDAYMQRRESLVRDGESPRTSYELDDPAKTEASAANQNHGEAQADVKQSNPAISQRGEPAGKSVVEKEQGAALVSHAAVVATESAK